MHVRQFLPEGGFKWVIATVKAAVCCATIAARRAQESILARLAIARPLRPVVPATRNTRNTSGAPLIAHADVKKITFAFWQNKRYARPQWRRVSLSYALA